MVHHRTGQGQCVGHDGAGRTGLAKVLGRLWVAGPSVEPERRSAVADVGSSDHGVEESRVVVHTDILNLQHVDVSTGLLVEEVLLHGFVDFFSSHLVLEVATDRLVHLVHVGANVLARQDGWCTKDTHGLSSVVVGIRRVAASSWIEAVVDGEVANLVVAGDGLAGGIFVVLHAVEAFEVDEVVVEVVDGSGGVSVKSCGEQLCDQGQAGVVAVNGRRNRSEFVDQVGRVPVITDDGVRAFLNRFFGGSNVVVEGDVGLIHGTPRIANTGR